MNNGTTWGKKASDLLYYKLYNPHLSPSTAKQISFLLRTLKIKKGASVLDIPCGYGRHSIELSEKGFRITGIDISPHFISIAKKQSKNLNNKPVFMTGSWFKIPYENNFDVILNLFTSFGYTTVKDDDKVLGQYRRALKKNGKLLIDVNNRPLVAKRFSTGIKQSDGSFVLSSKIRIGKDIFHRKESFNPETKQWIMSIKKGSHAFRANVHIYGITELKSLLRKNKFKNIKAYGDFDGRKYSKSSKRLIIVASK